MPFGPIGARQLLVGDLTDEGMTKSKLGFGGDRRASFAPDELAPFQPVEALFDGPPTLAGDVGHATEPEHLAQDGGLLDHLLVGRRQGIKASGDDRLHALGQGLLQPAFLDQPDELLRVQRISAGPLDQCLLNVGGQQRPHQQGMDERGRVLIGQRGERECQRVRLPPPQPGRRLSSSGRAVASRSSGTPAAHSAT